MTWLIERADKGNAIAQNILGVAYCLGKGVVQNYERSVGCFKAAEKACVEAQCNLAISYWLGEGVPQDQNAAIDCYCKAAERGCAAAQFHVGMAYLLGNGSTQDADEAIKWLCKAADQYFSAAQYQLSLIYWTAQDGHRDHNKALDLLSKAANQGNVEAQYALAMAYWEGNSIEQDYIKAMKWLLEAAEQGFLDAQVTLTGRFRSLSNVPFGGKKFSCYSKCTLKSIELMLKRHCMLCGVNNPISSLEGSEFAVPGLLDSFDKITHFESLLLKLLIDLNRLEAGFMISCFKPNQEIIDALSQRDSSHIHWDSGAGLLTIGEYNVRTARLLNRLLTGSDFESVIFLLQEYSNMPKLRIQAELLDIQRRAKTTPEDVGEGLKNEFQLKIAAYNEVVENPTDEMKLVEKEVKILADLKSSLQRFIREGTAFRNDRFLMEYSYFNMEE